MGAEKARSSAIGRVAEDRQKARRDRLALVADRVAPLGLARERTLPVHGALAAQFPGGALQRGAVVTTSGMGATSLALAVAAGPSSAGSWTAFVGCTDIGLAAAGELGIVLERILVVVPGSTEWLSTVAALVGAVEVIIVSPHHRIRETDARRIAARLRERGSVLVVIGDRWPVTADVRLDVTGSSWNGLGVGHGMLTTRAVRIAGGGRRAAARPRALDVLLPGTGGAPQSVDRLHR